MISSQVKMYIAWGTIATLLCGTWVHHKYKVAEIERQNEEQCQYEEQTVNPLLRKVNDTMCVKIKEESPYDYAQLLQEMQALEQRMDESSKNAAATKDELDRLTAEELPEAELRRWKSLKADLERSNGILLSIADEAERLYNNRTEMWVNSAAGELSAPALTDAEDLCQKLRNEAKTAEDKMDEVYAGEEAYIGYEDNADLLTKYALILEQYMEELKKFHERMRAEKEKVISAAGEINHDSAEMKAIDESLQRILAAKPFPLPAVTPVLYVAPPPPPFEPDVTIIATGDLSSALLEPLVLNWLRSQAATGVDGSRLTWVDGDEEKLRPFETASRELEAQVPPAIQGKESGKLRIRITTTKQPESVFALLQNGREQADLVLTGRKMKEAELRRWLPVGKTLAEMDTENKGRAYRTRVCADALVFFRGQELPLKTIKAGDLYTHTKVFMANNPALSEAAEIFGLRATAADKEDANANVDELSTQNPNAIVLGTWHKDGRTRAATISVQDGPALNYVVGLDKTSLANADSRYTANDDGYAPTEDTINSGRYAYSHDIFFFRSATDSAATPAVKSLMSYAGNIEDADLTRLIRNCGFVPPIATGTTEKTEHSRLTNADLPIDILLSKLPKGYGYTKGVNTWVYGKRIAIPLYYEVGSTTSIEIDPDSDYYTTHGNALNAIPRDRKACLVCVGHADPRWKGQLSSDKDSWLGNLALSEKRADIILDTKFRPMFQSADNLSYVSFGCSWARPACDIALEQGADVQERELARSRRVEIFVVLPFDTKKE